MAYSAMDVAKYTISYYCEQGSPISNLKLQKILYFSWIEYYKQKKQHLFEDSFCAWKFGPVVPDVYYEYCIYAGMPIPDYPYDKNPKTLLSGADQNILNPILHRYIGATAHDLVDKTHEEGKPWSVIYQNGEGNRSVIPFPLIINKECEGKV